MPVLLSLFGVAFVMSGLSIVVCVVAARRRDEGTLSVFFLFTIFLFSVASYEAFDQGRIADRALDPSHNYLVKVKKQSELGIPLLVYDMVDKKDRIIDLEIYPPSGFSEVVAVGGKTLLIPK